jgi:FkbM family methyltransferase
MNSIERSARWLKYKCGLKDSSVLTVGARPYYNRFLEAVYGRRGLVRVMEGQERIRICPSQRYFHNGFEAGLFDYLRKTVKEGDVILEIGANVGIFTVILARWVGSSGHVYAFEPTPEASATLRRHLALNRVEDRVTILPDAISDAPGRSAFYVEGTSGENTLSGRHSRIPSADRIEVQVTTIDAFCRERGIAPTLIKIDIEGYEFHALRGALGVIGQYSPGIVIELHPMNWPDIGVSSEYARQFISGLNYRQIALDGKSDPFSAYGHLLLERFGQVGHVTEEMRVIPVESSAEPPGREVLRG